MTTLGDLPRLTPKQEGWLEDYQATGNASEAYRKNYASDNMKQTTIARNAHALLNNSKIQTILEQQKAVKQADRVELEELAKAHVTKAIQTAADIMNDKDSGAGPRMAAVREILDRAVGKPISKTELDATLKGSNAAPEEMSDEALMALLSTKGEG